MIKIEKYNSLTKLLRIASWLYRFANNLKNKITKMEILLKLSAESFWLKENLKSFDEKKLKTSRHLTLMYVDVKAG